MSREGVGLPGDGAPGPGVRHLLEEVEEHRLGTARVAAWAEGEGATVQGSLATLRASMRLLDGARERAMRARPAGLGDVIAKLQHGINHDDKGFLLAAVEDLIALDVRNRTKVSGPLGRVTMTGTLT